MIAPPRLAAGDTCCVLVQPLDDIQAESLALQLKALADPVRLRLVSIIATSPTGSVCACNLPDAVGKSQPTVSHHLRQLVDAGVLERRQRGKWAWFRLVPDGLGSIRSALGENTEHQHTADPAVLFVSAGDAGRSQMAAGFLRDIAGGHIVVDSAGSVAGGRPHATVVEAMGERDIDITTATPRQWSDDLARTADVIVTMGCSEECTIRPGTRHLDWVVDDPAGLDIDEVRRIRDEIERLVIGLADELTPDCCA